MPLYEFINEEHGIAVDLRLPVDGRPDEIVLRRRTAPTRISIRGFTGAPTSDAADQALAGYKALEDSGRLGTGEFTPDQIKTAWAS